MKKGTAQLLPLTSRAGPRQGGNRVLYMIKGDIIFRSSHNQNSEHGTPDRDNISSASASGFSFIESITLILKAGFLFIHHTIEVRKHSLCVARMMHQRKHDDNERVHHGDNDPPGTQLFRVELGGVLLVPPVGEVLSN